MRIAKTLLDEINPEDDIPFFDEFVKDIGGLENVTGTLEYQSDLRNRLVTFIAENYVPRETGRIICPACLTETPNNLSICIRCHGSLISWGRRLQNKMKAQPLECLNMKGNRLVMALKMLTRMWRWTRMRSIGWSKSQRRRPKKEPTMMWTCQIRGLANLHQERRVDERDLLLNLRRPIGQDQGAARRGGRTSRPRRRRGASRSPKETPDLDGTVNSGINCSLYRSR